MSFLRNFLCFLVTRFIIFHIMVPMFFLSSFFLSLFYFYFYGGIVSFMINAILVVTILF